MLVTTRGYLGLSGGGCLPTDGHFNGEHDVFEPHDSEDTTNTTNTCDLFWNDCRRCLCGNPSQESASAPDVWNWADSWNGTWNMDLDTNQWQKHILYTYYIERAITLSDWAMRYQQRIVNITKQISITKHSNTNDNNYWNDPSYNKYIYIDI